MLVGGIVCVGVLGWRVIKRGSNVGSAAAVGETAVPEGSITMVAVGWSPGDWGAATSPSPAMLQPARIIIKMEITRIDFLALTNKSLPEDGEFT